MNTPLWRALLVAPTASAITLCGFTGALAVDVAPDGASPGTSVLITSASPLPTAAPVAEVGRNAGQSSHGTTPGNGGQGSDGATPGNGHNGNGTQGNGGTGGQVDDGNADHVPGNSDQGNDGQGHDGATPGNGGNGGQIDHSNDDPSNGDPGNSDQGNGGQGHDGATPGNGGNGGQIDHGNDDPSNGDPGNSDQGNDGTGSDGVTPGNGGSALEHEEDSESGGPAPAPVSAAPVMHGAEAPAPRPVGAVGLPDTSSAGTGWDHAPQIGSVRPVSTVRTSVQNTTVMSRSAGAEALATPPAAGTGASTSGAAPSAPSLPDSLAYTGVPGGVLSAGGLGALLLALGAALRLKRA